MKQLLPLSILLISGVSAHSQAPVLDFANTGTLPGESYVYHACAWQSPGSSGIGQTWDFSTFTTDSLINISFVDPAGTPEAASFPTATIAADNGGDAYAYSEFVASGGSFLGMTLPGEAPIVYSDPMLQAYYPSTYMTSWTDDYAASFSVAGFAVVRSGTISAEADAYGTLILPYGNLTDVLRVTYVDDYDDVSLITVSSHREYTYYLQAGTHYPIAEIFSYATTVLGNTTTITGSHWLDIGSVGVAPLPVPSASLMVTADPSTDAIHVDMQLETGPAVLDLIGTTGAVLEHRALGALPSGHRTERFATGGIAGGLYLVRLHTGDRTIVRRVALE